MSKMIKIQEIRQNLLLLANYNNKSPQKNKWIRAMQNQPTAQQFIGYYNSLTNQKLASQSNKKLMQLQQSQNSWQISKQMILDSRYNQHGYQLLSKKLNRPYTKQMQNRLKIAQFLASLQYLNQTAYFCLAKIAIHLNWHKIEIKGHEGPNQVLKVLSQIPNAACVITLYPSQKEQDDNERKRANRIFNTYKQYLTQAFDSYPKQVLECLESFTSNNFKLSSQNLMRVLLKVPLKQSWAILQNVLLEQKVPQSLYGQIYNYLLANETQSDLKHYYNVFLAFIRSMNIIKLQPQPLTGLFTKLLGMLKLQNTLNTQQKSDCHFITDSFEFWIELGDALMKASNDSAYQTQVEIVKSAFVEVWSIVVERALLPSMPLFKKQEVKEEIVIDSDDDGYEDPHLSLFRQNPLSKMDVDQKFRQIGQQFLDLIFSALAKSNPHRKKVLEYIYNLAQSPNSLNLQLAVFVISSIAAVITQNCIEEISVIILQITKNTNAKDPYIWQQLIKLIGKLGHQAVCNGSIFSTVLIVLKQSMFINQLSILACENFNQILVTCSNSAQKQAQTQVLQQFFDFMYSNLYFKTPNPQVFNLLTKSTILFIYYFRPDLEYFKNYLTALNQKIQMLKNIQDRFQVIENLALHHLYVRSQHSVHFVSLISQFLCAFLPVALGYVKGLSGRKLAGVCNQLSIIVGTGAGYHTQVWAQFISELAQLQNLQNQRYLSIQIFNKLLTVSQTDPNTYKHYCTQFIKKVQPYVTNSLLSCKSSDQFKLINKCLNFHFIVLGNFIEYLPQYNPDNLLLFIFNSILKGEMKFEFQSCRTGLAILNNVLDRGYRMQQILEEVLRAYPKLADFVWKSLETILTQAYKKGGVEIYRAAFSNVYPALLPPNPLFQHLVLAISESRGKDYKNLLAVLK